MNIIKLVEQRLEEFVDELEIIDESYLHESHHAKDDAGAHLILNIKSKKLSEMKLIAAHKLVYSKLQDLIPHKLHAVSLKIF